MEVLRIPTVATSLMGDLGAGYRFTFLIAQRVIDEIITVPDEQILQAVDALRSDDGFALEPSAAAGAAYLRADDH